MLTLKENMMRVYNHQEPEYQPLYSDFNSAMPAGMDFINERPEIPGTNLDWFGQSWTWEEKTHAANPTPGKPLLTDITKWREVIKFPDLDVIDWETHAAKDTANWDRENKMSRVTVGFGLWERLFSIMPFEDALCALIEEPEECYEFFGAIADHKIRLHDKVIEYYKPDILCMHDDYGNNANLFMDPETWRRVLKPHLKRVVDAVQSKGVIYEHHNCGYFAPLMDDMIEIGIGATNPVHSSNDIVWLKENYGDKMTFLGGFDAQMYCRPDATEEEILADLEHVFEVMAPGTSFIPLCISFWSKHMPFIGQQIARLAAKYHGPRP
ncbi:MAG: hypothetical protein IKC09_07910 [Oscillospiraceae bacterium]|nr:hypothetical protein [Oscillospiraceae bacterium]MBR2890182.1 hypothetical protein [Oscillospiraceae bacterium]